MYRGVTVMYRGVTVHVHCGLSCTGVLQYMSTVGCNVQGCYSACPLCAVMYRGVTVM